jgi:hypothetical protein
MNRRALLKALGLLPFADVLLKEPTEAAEAQSELASISCKYREIEVPAKQQCLTGSYQIEVHRCCLAPHLHEIVTMPAGKVVSLAFGSLGPGALTFSLRYGTDYVQVFANLRTHMVIAPGIDGSSPLFDAVQIENKADSQCGYKLCALADSCGPGDFEVRG